MIDNSVWLAPGVQLYGRVLIGEGSSLWPYAVIRAECHEVRIGRMTNIQDFAMVHVRFDGPTVIGDFCSIAHHVTIDGATIENDCMIGINATIMAGAVICTGSVVAAGAVVKAGATFPPSSTIAGIPAKVIRQQDSTVANRMNAWVYHRNAEAYRKGDHRAWEGQMFEAWRAAKLAEITRDRR